MTVAASWGSYGGQSTADAIHPFGFDLCNDQGRVGRALPLLDCCIFSNSSENVVEIMQQVRLLQMTSDVSRILSHVVSLVCYLLYAIHVAQVSTIEGFVTSSFRSLEGDATEAVYQGLLKQQSRVKVLEIRELTTADGRKREVDGVVVADDCAAIVEAKQQLDDSAVPQLSSCLDFIRCGCHT
jgi:hypothetical protein